MRVAAAVGAHKPGDRVTLGVQRKGTAETTDVAVTLGENPNKAGAAYLPIDEQAPQERRRMILEDAAPKVVLGAGQGPQGLARRRNGDAGRTAQSPVCL